MIPVNNFSKNNTRMEKIEIKLNTFLHKDIIIDNSVTGLDTGGGHQAADPSIIWDPIKKRWLVYFFAVTNGFAEIYVAESNDLLNFRFIGKAVSKGSQEDFDNVYAHKPGAIFYDDLFYLFYSGDNGRSRSIGVAISRDGVNFTKNSNNPILIGPEGTNYLGAPSIIR